MNTGTIIIVIAVVLLGALAVIAYRNPGWAQRLVGRFKGRS